MGARPLPKILIQQSEKVLIVGDYQTGKTNLAKFFLKQTPRYLVWDPTYAFGARLKKIDSVGPFFDQFGRATYQPGRGNLDAKFDQFCELAIRKSNALIFIDEPALISKLPSSFYDLHRLGHKRGLGVMLATHRIQGDLPALAQVTHHLFAFHCNVIFDVYTLKGIVGDEGASWIQNAPKYHYWYKGPRFNGPGPLIPKVK